ncbi:hypothetical protein PHLCEN_2v11061 [Hermanssonia centrifuga]|uniref:Uncharacterized protein n=1 Tax=Hermanssonia centrifuga TaxID=98765 RepID=A0A2R6NLE5_9APHY|nr:hypothetical protein PHLCEN_2v11061 [Hermanssonia centrifuga]
MAEWLLRAYHPPALPSLPPPTTLPKGWLEEAKWEGRRSSSLPAKPRLPTPAYACLSA